MKVFITQPHHSKLEPWELNRLLWIRRTVAKAATTYSDLSSIELSSTPEDADIIVLLEPCVKTNNYSEELLQEEVIHLKPFRVYTLNYDDKPLGILPGLYSSLEEHNFNCHYHLSWPHLDCPNNLVDNYIIEDSSSQEDSLLFTFSGRRSHPIREKIFSVYSKTSSLYKVTEVDKFFNHNEDEKSEYMKDILCSKYVLCPHGYAAYSHRIFETIILGKVPVIIADAWIPFSIPETNYYIRIREKDIEDLPKILFDMESEYEERIRTVKAVREKYFLKSRKYAVAIAQLIDLHSKIGSDLTYDSLVQQFLSTLEKSNTRSLETI